LSNVEEILKQQEDELRKSEGFMEREQRIHKEFITKQNEEMHMIDALREKLGKNPFFRS
jgi:hypothetical protein